MAPCSRARSCSPDPGVGQRAEAGVDAVDRRCHPRWRAVTTDRLGSIPAGTSGPELGAGLAARHVHDVLDGEAVAFDDHCSHG